jgi:nucleotide-binding universal stress UspA family protein
MEASVKAHPTVLCPIDFSEASAGALRYAAAIATHIQAKLIVLSVEDPLLTEALDLGTGVMWTPDLAKQDMAQFAASTFGSDAPMVSAFEYEVAVGKSAPEIMRVARERACDLIVISTHGLTGMRKLFFGSTTERVLRETTVPVLVTPPHDPGPIGIDDAKRLLHRILVPVDLSSASLDQVQVARTLAEALGLPLILVNVVEPLKTRLAARLDLAGVEADRRAVAEDGLNELMSTLPRRLHPEALVAYGDPAEELAKVVRDRQAGLVVMGLHASPMLGPRMGSVTYRLLCLSHGMVLALPPSSALNRKLHFGDSAAVGAVRQGDRAVL